MLRCNHLVKEVYNDKVGDKVLVMKRGGGGIVAREDYDF